MKDYGFTVKTDEVMAKLLKFEQKAVAGAAAGLFDAANQIMEGPNGARDQAPVDTTALRESGKVLEPDISIKSIVSVRLGFGDSAIPYAHRQHEELDWRHPKHGKAKYLEDPLNAAAEGVPAIVSAAIQEAVKNL